MYMDYVEDVLLFFSFVVKTHVFFLQPLKKEKKGYNTKKEEKKAEVHQFLWHL